ncbi:2TM domain-containing protein [Roseateles sp. BYS87W]|uniref:2TM domain-containing protein n=1 Tax=Pelomonas baiyunensis TaxID=3299026 RepID=A0ABW7H414_9BURK
MNTPTARDPIHTPASAPVAPDLHALAARRVDLKLGFLTHLGVFLAVNTGLALLGYLRGGELHLPFPVWGWGIGLVAHAVGTAISLSGPSLRERLMGAELAALQKR